MSNVEIQATLYEHHISPELCQAAYDLILDALMVAGLNRAEAIVGLLMVLGTQYNGEILEPEETKRYIDEACGWFNMYFAKGEKH